MPHEVDLRGNVPLYAQQQWNWCGAASAQMIMNGYPNPADRLFDTQANIWNTIQANNSTNPTDVNQNWATDPIGLRECLMLLNRPPAPGAWNVHMNTVRDTLMFDILYWMNRLHYPVATLINRGQHWVVILRYITDVEPLAGSAPVLQTITKNDPWPVNIGSQSTMTGAVWNATDWTGPVQYPGSWLNNYTAIIEPPVEKGKVKVEEMVRIGERIITPEKAIDYAKKWIDELKLGEKSPYSILLKKGITNLQPLLVREEIKSNLDEAKKVPYYYIVPFGFEREKGDCDVRLARISIIVNAFTGQFEDITVFGRPVRYLPQREAITVATKAMRLSQNRQNRIKGIKATIMFKPSRITHIRAYPFWKITVEERVVYVDQLGKVYTAIQPSVPGD